MPDDPVCHSEACAGHGCPRSTHRFGGFLSSGADRQYLGCTTHRRCEAFEQVEPLAPLSLQLLSEVERAAIGQRLDRADVVLAEAAPTWPEEAAYWTEDADGDPGGPLRPGPEVITDERRLTVEAPVEAAPPELDDLCEGYDPYDHPIGPVGAPLVPLRGISQQLATSLMVAATSPLDEHFPPPIESYNAWRCTSCFSRSLKPGRCCKRSMQAIRMVMYAREVPDA